MAHVVYKITTCLLLLTAVRSSGVQPKQIIYADKGSWTIDSNHRENELRENVEAALDGIEQHNSTLVVVKQNCKNPQRIVNTCSSPSLLKMFHHAL